LRPFLNFAFGSNLLIERLQQRAPSAAVVSAASLSEHALRWHKRSKDGSGKCDALHTGAGIDVVWGVVFRIADAERAALDLAEGLGRGYVHKQVVVQAGPHQIEALMYSATDVDPNLRPYHWYKAYVVAGARQHSLPSDYIQRIEGVVSIPDPDSQRAKANLLP
jgi:hypothetical protein